MTTRRISNESIMILDELQTHLKRYGIKTTQKELIETSVKLAMENEKQVIKSLKKKEDNTAMMTNLFLKNAKKFDFGEKWLKEIDSTI